MKLLTIKEYSELKGIPPRTVYYQCKTGKIETVEVMGRIAIKLSS